jgi:hypothetical protein
MSKKLINVTKGGRSQGNGRHGEASQIPRSISAAKGRAQESEPGEEGRAIVGSGKKVAGG